jgi:HAD superfamily hydrolase (TIGR01509 family)
MAFSAPLWTHSEASAVLFDWDGVIADTKLDFSEIRKKYYGDRPAMLLEDAYTLSPGARESLTRDLEDLETRGAERATLVPGADKILGWVKNARIPWAVISRNCRKSILTAARAIGVELPEVVRSRDDGERVKPDPAALRETCVALGVSPRDTLLIGDYIYDMIGARRAGMRGVLTRGDKPDGWDAWLECHYSSMDEFHGAIVSGERIIAWEYIDAASRLGIDFLRAAREITLPARTDASPSVDAWVARAASLGVGRFSVGGDEFTPEMWRRNPSLDVALIGHSLEFVLRDFLRDRWPFAEVTRGGSDLHPPRDANALEDYLLSITK